MADPKYTCKVGFEGEAEEIDLDEFIQTNSDPDVEPLTEGQVAALRALKPGEETWLGGGAGETFIVRRVQ